LTGKQQTQKTSDPFPMLKTVEQMSRVSGIGENKLRELMDNRKIEFVQNGNRRLLADAAIWDWYERNKVCVGSEGA
jgi:excisionase family DNA binding protein